MIRRIVASTLPRQSAIPAMCWSMRSEGFKTSARQGPCGLVRIIGKDVVVVGHIEMKLIEELCATIRVVVFGDVYSHRRAVRLGGAGDRVRRGIDVNDVD